MAFRIGVVGAGPTTLKKVKKAAKARGGDVAELADGASLPSAVTAVVGPAKEAETLAQAAMSIAGRQNALLQLLAQAIDAREGIPLANAERVRETAERFAEAMELDTDETGRFVRGALLHDIGKLALTNAVLLTKAMLTHDEWQELRAHTVKGRDMVLRLEGFEDIADIVGGHHECWDGTGYPEELEGAEIPKLARAMKLVDVFVSMTGPRHYRDGMASPAEAFRHIEEEAGKHFDPELAALFLKTFR